MSGKLIVLYGISHRKKEEVASRMVSYLRAAGLKAEYLKYPIYSIAPSGFYMEKVLRGKEKMSEEEFQLWAVLNRLQYQPVLRKKLEEGAIIIAEDYTGTGIAWGAAKGLDKSWVEEINKPATKPDLTILLNTNQFSASLENFAYAQSELVERVRENLLELARTNGWTIIDANRDTGAVVSEVIAAVKPVLGI